MTRRMSLLDSLGLSPGLLPSPPAEETLATTTVLGDMDHGYPQAFSLVQEHHDRVASPVVKMSLHM